MEQTKKTIEHASRLGAKAVILHLGRNEQDVSKQTELERQLKILFESGNGHRDDVNRLKAEMVKTREAGKSPCLEVILRSLDDFESYATKHGVVLGIENRAHSFEIPSFEEIEIILDRFYNSTSRKFYEFSRRGVV